MAARVVSSFSNDSPSSSSSSGSHSRTMSSSDHAGVITASAASVSPVTQRRREGLMPLLAGNFCADPSGSPSPSPPTASAVSANGTAYATSSTTSPLAPRTGLRNSVAFATAKRVTSLGYTSGRPLTTPSASSPFSSSSSPGSSSRNSSARKGISPPARVPPPKLDESHVVGVLAHPHTRRRVDDSLHRTPPSAKPVRLAHAQAQAHAERLPASAPRAPPPAPSSSSTPQRGTPSSGAHRTTDNSKPTKSPASAKRGRSSGTSPPAGASDILAISDQALADKFHFVREIGFGNWGSVWEVKSKQHVDARPLAVKLVHRSKTPTTAARVRALWTEYKCIRALRGSMHPNIIAFDAFILTPSYSLVVMECHPRLIQIDLGEADAKPYFRAIVSAVSHLHAHGISHNDIKAGNILLSAKNQPILVDFGFAQCYDLSSSDAFLTQMAWGTPEYLAPERARGLLHDERLSDIWSLGCLMYEVVVGRTPFERTDTEEFLTKEALEVYYGRTTKGSFCGVFEISKEFEDLIHRMVEPSPQLRMQRCNEVLHHKFFRPQRTPSTPSSKAKKAQPSPPRPALPPKPESPAHTPFKIHCDAAPTPPRSASLVNSSGALTARRVNTPAATPELKRAKEADKPLRTPPSQRGTPRKETASPKLARVMSPATPRAPRAPAAARKPVTPPSKRGALKATPRSPPPARLAEDVPPVPPSPACESMPSPAAASFGLLASPSPSKARFSFAQTPPLSADVTQVLESDPRQRPVGGFFDSTSNTFKDFARTSSRQSSKQSLTQKFRTMSLKRAPSSMSLRIKASLKRRESSITESTDGSVRPSTETSSSAPLSPVTSELRRESLMRTKSSISSPWSVAPPVEGLHTAPRARSRSVIKPPRESSESETPAPVKIKRPSLAPSFVKGNDTTDDTSIKTTSTTFRPGHRRVPTACRSVPSIMLTESGDDASVSEVSSMASSSFTASELSVRPPSRMIEEARELPTFVPVFGESSSEVSESDGGEDEDPTIRWTPPKCRPEDRSVTFAQRASLSRPQLIARSTAEELVAMRTNADAREIRSESRASIVDKALLSSARSPTAASQYTVESTASSSVSRGSRFAGRVRRAFTTFLR